MAFKDAKRILEENGGWSLKDVSVKKELKEVRENCPPADVSAEDAAALRQKYPEAFRVSPPGTRGETIRSKAIELLSTRPEGIRYSELVREIHHAFPEIPANTIHGNVWDLTAVYPDDIYKPAKGVFKAVKFRETSPGVIDPTPPPSVIDSIAEFLLAASEQEPLTKEQIVARLAQRFPDRDSGEIAATVDSQLPNGIQADDGLVLSDNGQGGYWARRQEPIEKESRAKRGALAAKLMAVLTDKPQTVAAIKQAAATKSGYGCLKQLAEKGLIIRTEDGRYLLKQSGTDRFGGRLSLSPARINAVLSSEPKTAEEIAKEAGVTVARVKGHLNLWIKKTDGLGKVLVRDEDKWYLREGFKRDEFGIRAGTMAAKINSAVTAKPKTTDEIIRDSGQSNVRVRDHLKWLIEKGYVVKTEDGKYALTTPRQPGTEDASARNNRFMETDLSAFDFSQPGAEDESAENVEIEPGDTGTVVDMEGEEQPWNGEFYVSFGGNDNRDWQEACKYGFISAGGGSWYTKSLRMLKPGDRIWVNITGGVGYVGVGRVIEEVVPIDDFQVEDGNGNRVAITSLPLKAAKHSTRAQDPEKAEHMVRVEWLKTVPVEEAVREKGLFGNQHPVTKPQTEKWAHTIERLKSRFGISD